MVSYIETQRGRRCFSLFKFMERGFFDRSCRGSKEQMKMNKPNNDTKYLQSLIDKGGEITITAGPDGNVYEINTPLVVKSGCHITLDGSVLRLADGVYSNIFISDGAWNDAVKEEIPLITDVKLTGKNGAKLDGGTPNDLNEKTANKNGFPKVLNNSFVLFRNVDGFEISNLPLSDPRYWCLTFYYCRNGIISDIEFNASNSVPNQDGIDLRRGCHDIEIKRLRGSTGDDTVALTALRHSAGTEDFDVPGESYDICNVTISDVSAEVTGGHGIIRLLNHDGIKLHDVVIRDIYDKHIDNGGQLNQAAIRLGDANYWTIAPASDGDMYNITVENVTTNSPTAVKVHGVIENLNVISA